MSTYTDEERIKALILEVLKKRAVPVNDEASHGREDLDGEISYIRI